MKFSGQLIVIIIITIVVQLSKIRVVAITSFAAQCTISRHSCTILSSKYKIFGEIDAYQWQIHDFPEEGRQLLKSYYLPNILPKTTRK